LYHEFAEDLGAFLTGVLKDADAAAEALQATFAKAVEVGQTVRVETVRGWLYRVAMNEALAVRRRRKVHEKSLRHLVAACRASELPEDVVCREETVTAVRAALETLPEEQRHVVRLRIYEEKTFAVIAEELGVPLGTVLTRMRLALKKLSARFPKPEP
jgi:RNA polymerase sigma-70 factor (ECF subfamily)